MPPYTPGLCYTSTVGEGGSIYFNIIKKLHNEQQLNAKAETGGTKPLSTSTRFTRIKRSGGPTARTPKFEGCCNNLKRYVFDCSGSWQAGKFADNIGRVIDGVGRE